MLDAGELDWLNDYHARVRREVRPHLDEATKVWLDAATRRWGIKRRESNLGRRK